MAQLFQFPYRTVAEVALNALVKNVATLRTLSKREVIPVVKADAYGHGMVSVAKALYSRASVEMLAVATLEEGMELRKRLPQGAGILVLSGFHPHQFEACVKYHLTPVIHSLAHLKSLIGHGKLPDLHLKIDTGMNRLGIKAGEVNEAVRVLEKLDVKLAGLMSHYAESESTTSSFADEQLKSFEDVHALLQSHKLLATDARIHISNSGGIIRGKLGISNAVRPGIGLYGVVPNVRWEEDGPDLIPVMQWKARVITVKTVARGETIGYGRTYRAKRRERIAILGVGYADGYPRAVSGSGEVLIHGKRAAVRGRVSMDLIAVDVSHLHGVKEGTVATLIGTDHRDRLSVWELAAKSDTIPYEVFCGISARVPRVYID